MQASRWIQASRLIGCTGIPPINRRTRINHTSPEDIPGKLDKEGVQRRSVAANNHGPCLTGALGTPGRGFAGVSPPRVGAQPRMGLDLHP